MLCPGHICRLLEHGKKHTIMKRVKQNPTLTLTEHENLNECSGNWKINAKCTENYNQRTCSLPEASFCRETARNAGWQTFSLIYWQHAFVFGCRTFRKSVTFSTSYYKKYTEIRNILHERILPSQIDTTVCFFFCDLGVRIWPANSNFTTSNSSAKAIMAAPLKTVVRSVHGWRFPGILIWTLSSQSVGDWCVLTIVHPPNMAIRFFKFYFSKLFLLPWTDAGHGCTCST